MTPSGRFTGKQIVAVLMKAGFRVERKRGSHVFLAHQDGRATVVPIHSGEVIGPGLFAKILRDVELTKDQFVSVYQQKK
jgi:predicted RNA binding protein YcfA (HicA-like mRNA interferase family)